MSVTRHNGIEEDDLGAFIYYDEFLEVEDALMEAIKSLNAENARLRVLLQQHQTYTPKQSIKECGSNLATLTEEEYLEREKEFWK